MSDATFTLEVRELPTGAGRCLRIGRWRNERGEITHIAIAEGYESDAATWTRTSIAAVEIPPEHAEAVARALLELAGDSRNGGAQR